MLFGYVKEDKMAYSLDLRERAVSLVEEGRPVAKVIKLLKIGSTTLYSWLKKKAAGQDLRPSKNGSFIRKIDPKVIEEYVRKHPDHTLAEMQRNLGFSIPGIWYRLKQLKIASKKKDHALPRAQ